MPDPIPLKDPLTNEQIEQLVQQRVAQLMELAMIATQKGLQEIAEKEKKKAEENLPKGISLDKYNEFSRFFTTKTSEINRSLALGGIAIIWLFKKPSDGHLLQKDLLNLPLLLLVISLSIDLLQYFFASVAWRIFYERKYWLWKTKKVSNETVKDIEAPNEISLIIDGLFLAKIVFMILSYCHIFYFLSKLL